MRKADWPPHALWVFQVSWVLPYTERLKTQKKLCKCVVDLPCVADQNQQVSRSLSFLRAVFWLLRGLWSADWPCPLSQQQGQPLRCRLAIIGYRLRFFLRRIFGGLTLCLTKRVSLYDLFRLIGPLGLRSM